jgi:DNA excision repair protein ERCC-5
MEAEAQCAELVKLGLVDGIVTDDSDIFLFGGTRIYKNMFNAAKFVECYLASELEKEFLLDRKRLIRFAHLLGSDYTEGIPGVGPVTALEILTEFDTLKEFRDWCGKVQLGRPQDMEDQLNTPFRRKFRNTVQKRLFLPPGFPDERVDDAYLNPEVDSNQEEFQWGVPDLDKLRGYLMATIGWSQERTDEILVPVVRDMNKRETEGTQSNITRFFSGAVGVGATGRGINGANTVAAADGEGHAPRNRTGKESGRMKNAFKRLRGEAEKQRKRGENVPEPEDLVEGVGKPAFEEDEENELPGGQEVTGGMNNEKKKGATRTHDTTVDEEDADGHDSDIDADGEDDGMLQSKTKTKTRSKKKTRRGSRGKRKGKQVHHYST